MNLVVEAPQWLALALALLLVAGAVEDSARLRISNITCALIFVAALAAMAVVGIEWALWQNVVVFVVLMALGTLLFASGKFGGGDVKLLATTGLWFDMRGGLLMLTIVLLAGGVLALLILAVRMLGWSEGAIARVRLLKAGSGIPYGVAIATGALLTMAMLRA